MKANFISILIIVSSSAFAQNTDTLSKSNLQKIINKQFTTLITGQSALSIGNFAAVDLKDSKVAFASSFISKEANVLTIKASGGISDGFLSVFTNSKINTNIDLEFKYNIFLNKKNQSISFENSSYQKHLEKKRRILEENEKKKLDIEFEVDKMKLEQSKKDYQNTIKKIEKKLMDKIFYDSSSEDSLKYQLAKNRLELELLEKTVLSTKLSKQLELNNEIARQIKNDEMDLDIREFSLQWISFGYNVGRNSFKLFDSTKVYANQIISKAFTSHELSVQYSSYKWILNYRNSSYFNIGMSYKIMDNFNDLAPIEISEANKFTNNQTVRNTTKKYNAYTGEYIENNNFLKLHLDYYRFLLRNNTLAFHVYPEVSFLKKYTNTNLGLGLLFTFLDTKSKDKSKVNVELYYNIVDVFDSSNSNISLLKRNDIGLRFSFPIIFKN